MSRKSVKSAHFNVVYIGESVTPADPVGGVATPLNLKKNPSSGLVIPSAWPLW